MFDFEHMRYLSIAAVRESTPAILDQMEFNGSATSFYIVVAVRRAEGGITADDPFEGQPPSLHYQVLHEENIGAPKVDWQWPFDLFAHGKAELTGRTGLPGREVFEHHPSLLISSDVCYWGSVISGDLIVAGSGDEEVNDETYCGIVLEMLNSMLADGIREARSLDLTRFTV